MRVVEHPLTVLVVDAVAHAGVGGYVILYLGVAASWVGVPIVGAGALAAAGVLASEGELDLWLVIVVAAVAAWTGGYVGYLIGVRAGDAVSERPGRRQRQRQHAIKVGERIYRRWGRLAVFVTPTFVSGALRMPRNTFLVWNALAAIVSTCIATLGAYGIGTAVLGQLSARRGTIALAVTTDGSLAGSRGLTCHASASVASRGDAVVSLASPRRPLPFVQSGPSQAPIDASALSRDEKRRRASEVPT